MNAATGSSVSSTDFELDAVSDGLRALCDGGVFSAAAPDSAWLPDVG